MNGFRAPPQLETLPTEIRILLMHQLDSTTTLFSLLRASPTFLQAYRNSRDDIFRDVVCNYVSTKLLPIALISMRLRDASSTAIADFYEHAVENLELARAAVPLLSTNDARRLLSIHKQIDWLSQDAMEKSLGLLRVRLSGALGSDLGPPPSFTERFRVLRAFYAREVMSAVGRYRRTAAVVPLSLPGISWVTLLYNYLAVLEFHELEELRFVFNYVKRRLSTLLGQAEDDRYEEFISRGPQHGWYSWASHDADRLFSQGFHQSSDYWLESILYRENTSTIYELIHAGTASERLSRLRKLEPHFYASGPAGAFQRYHKSSTSTFISATFSSDQRLSTWKTSSGSVGERIETSDAPNSGMLWAAARLRHHQDPTDLLDRLLASGIAVWDADRLRNSGLFCKAPWQIACKQNPFTILGVRDRPSVEARAWAQAARWEADGLLPKEPARVHPVIPMCSLGPDPRRCRRLRKARTRSGTQSANDSAQS